MTDVAKTEPVQADTQNEQQSKPVEPTKVEMTESEKIAKVIADKDKGYEKMKNRMDTQVDGLTSQNAELQKRLDAIEKQNAEPKLVRPEKPYDFNYEDIVDTDSSSAKYLRQVANYDLKVEKAADKAEIKAIIDRQKIQDAELAKNEQLRQDQVLYKQRLDATIEGFVNLGRSEEDAARRAKYFHSNPESQSFESLDKFYDAIMPKDRGLEIEQRAERGKVPSPVSTGGGENPTTLTDAQITEAAELGLNLESMAEIVTAREKRKNRK